MTIGGLKKTSSPLALVAAAGFLMGGMALTPAYAADLGGDCCADLEERVAELEATTARKGNRKVSLAISGWVSRDFGWYEDEYGDSEIYSTGHGPSGSRVQFAGSAALSSSWTIGYVLRLRFDADRDSSALKMAGSGEGGGRSAAPAQDKNFIYFKNARLGTFVLGHAYGPTDGIASISLGGRGVTGNVGGDDWNGSTINGFDFEQDTSHQSVAWVSPTLRGFTFSAMWADLDDDAVGDSGVDMWQLALRYANEFGPIRIAGGIGWVTSDHNTDEDGNNVDGGDIMGSVALMHTPTGLNVSFSAGTEYDGGFNSYDGVAGNVDTDGSRGGAMGAVPATDNRDRQYWYIQGGVNRDFTGIGNTSIYGEYGDYDNDTGASANDVTMWGIGVVQHVDSAATELFLAYRMWEQDSAGTDGDVNQIMAGARIKF